MGENGVCDVCIRPLRRGGRATRRKFTVATSETLFRSVASILANFLKKTFCIANAVFRCWSSLHAISSPPSQPLCHSQWQSRSGGNAEVSGDLTHGCGTTDSTANPSFSISGILPHRCFDVM